ncbi:HTH domain-containing protein [Clostridium hydrogenum]|uniref:HTH domain-containing protein n=1 Tax=Clostridium hydrogenum TaxID=2855764 RepID=UPI001F259C92|nr:HTH domain-containing protein [Clostridium hydrogenum]
MDIEILRQSVSTNLNQIDCILREDIQNLTKNYKIELKSLSKIIGIDYTWLKEFMDGKDYTLDFFNNSRNLNENINNSNIPNPSYLSNMVYMLSDGILIVNEDDRIKAVIDLLISEFEIKYESLAIYAKLELEDVQNFMNDTNSISIEKKYKLAVASLFLHYLCKK